MRRRRPLVAFLVVAAAAASVIGLVSFTASNAGAQASWSAREKTSYALGHMLGEEARTGFQRDSVDFDPNIVVQGFVDALKGAKPAVTPADMQAMLTDLHRVVQERRTGERMKGDAVFRALAEENVRRGAESIDKLSKKPGAVELGEGVWALPLRPAAQGPSPKPTDTVVVTYVGTTATGQEFGRAVEAEMRIDQMLPAGRLALPKMRVGDRWLVAVPPAMAFGAAGRDPDIGPNETLLFDVELVAIK